MAGATPTCPLIEDLKKGNLENLTQRVHAIVAKPVDERYGTNSTMAQAEVRATLTKSLAV